MHRIRRVVRKQRMAGNLPSGRAAMGTSTSSASASRRRTSGILLHVTSLPSRFGVGDLGPAAYAWVDWLAKAKQTWWQILPTGPTSLGNSPYHALSAFAGNPLLISPELLISEGMLRREDAAMALEFTFPGGEVDYRGAGRLKARLLHRAWQRFQTGSAPRMRDAFETFCSAEAEWLDDFALFAAIRRSQRHKSWGRWPSALARRRASALRETRRELSQLIDEHRFFQFLFFRQWTALRAHARERGIRIIGDLPIFVSGDSADVWANPHLFQLDRNLRPKAVAGVPPDYFSTTGQRWGNPLYDWGAMKREGYRWWVNRARAVLRQVDIVRIDHFRGFESYWSIPAHLPTAVGGKWIKGPGASLFDVFKRALGGLPFIAEDLGLITPAVEALRDQFDLPGMRVLQFAFDSGPDNPFLPHNYIRNTVVYTGTHDNDTTAGWYASLRDPLRRAVRRYLNGAAKDVPWEMIHLAWSSIADRAIAPLQDVLGLASPARMNRPGTKTGNWRWRCQPGALTRRHLANLEELTAIYGRAPR